jgi:hypothetical protein
MTADAVLQALRRVWAALEPLQLPMAVMGGLALARYKHFRATRDVDILIGVTGTNVQSLLDLLATSGVMPKRSPPVRALGNLQIAQLSYEPPETFVEVQVDLLLADSAFHQKALARRVPMSTGLDRTPVWVLSCEDLIIVKLMAGRTIDLADAVSLLQLNAATLDQQYLARWTETLGLKNEWFRIQKEAADGQGA